MPCRPCVCRERSPFPFRTRSFHLSIPYPLLSSLNTEIGMRWERGVLCGPIFDGSATVPRIGPNKWEHTNILSLIIHPLCVSGCALCVSSLCVVYFSLTLLCFVCLCSCCSSPSHGNAF